MTLLTAPAALISIFRAVPVGGFTGNKIEPLPPATLGGFVWNILEQRLISTYWFQQSNELHGASRASRGWSRSGPWRLAASDPCWLTYFMLAAGCPSEAIAQADHRRKTIRPPKSTNRRTEKRSWP